MIARNTVASTLAMLLLSAAVAFAQWSPERLSEEDTLEFLSVDPEDGEHWSTVWLVVVDGQVFIRLGSRAADRLQGSTRWPFTDVRIDDEVFHNVRVEPTPQLETRVAEAMADKYWSDVLVRHMAHPLTARLMPAEPGSL